MFFLKERRRIGTEDSINQEQLTFFSGILDIPCTFRIWALCSVFTCLQVYSPQCKVLFILEGPDHKYLLYEILPDGINVFLFILPQRGICCFSLPTLY